MFKYNIYKLKILFPRYIIRQSPEMTIIFSTHQLTKKDKHLYSTKYWGGQICSWRLGVLYVSKKNKGRIRNGGERKRRFVHQVIN
jgi:hypothetical protein